MFFGYCIVFCGFMVRGGIDECYLSIRRSARALRRLYSAYYVAERKGFGRSMRKCESIVYASTVVGDQVKRGSKSIPL